MAKKQSPRKPPSQPRPGPVKPGKVKPVTDRSEPEKVKIGPLDPPPPSGGGGSTPGDDYQGT